MTRNRKNKSTGQAGEVQKGQRRGVCGHFMQLWDTHSRCPGCRKKGKGQDPCIEDRSCDACLTLTVGQRHLLRTSRTHDSRSPRRRPSPEPVPTRFSSPSRARGREPDRRPQISQVHRSPVHRSTGHRSTDHHRSGHHRSTGHTTGHKGTQRPELTVIIHLNSRKGL